MRRIDTLDDVAEGLTALLKAHPELAVVAERAGPLPLRRSEPGFPSLASVIVSQQVSKASAASIWSRLIGLIDPLTPQNYLAAGEQAWRAAGLSRAKQETLARISEAIIAGELDLLDLCERPIEEAMALMTRIKGVGPWTAEVYLLFSAGHADVFPSGDVALQHAYAHAYSESARPDSKALQRFAERWSPWRGVAARLFWAYYAATRGRDGTPIA
ncbi:DNA-3-methyladenine glycosylase family protein [Phyllobacterium pellucidum]|uniref:DNA-3-methyladenine glycosylase family protein n=1 Tax=Phyllobacterium pellucidum TaxID=2740464 RepID=UPI001D1397E8|nr:DNA-3-methyladenine glycosylase [Phyllobacterium sp. T1018]UGY09666.1 DNA-3-methyladenine glycosylase [Phyllobacterium sp. T1018]